MLAAYLTIAWIFSLAWQLARVAGEGRIEDYVRLVRSHADAAERIANKSFDDRGR
ncbi:hypothetical protein GCM10011371_08320 [Novosphingobium marinum]|uniref:Uncharacterized protein n=1 Tax=Novosphingobium marinum TaxID=1514948 RepID=A0A7Z0BUP6_9SPHN|nr:hypothetical protein [Novosphingobium marinum]NYH94520.1 hypothetical protein [Novosphingobium marinum]GGC22973.1 hypothetical protein GCM10011371_08320 [Novosphingobium marinum]